MQNPTQTFRIFGLRSRFFSPNIFHNFSSQVSPHFLPHSPFCMPSICVDRNPENVAGELWVPGSCEPRSTGPGCIPGPPARQLVPVLGETPESLAPKVPWAERHPREHGACRGRAAEFGPGGGAALGERPGDQPATAAEELASEAPRRARLTLCPKRPNTRCSIFFSHSIMRICPSQQIFS